MVDRSTRIRNLGIAAGLALAAAILTMLYVSRAQGGTQVSPAGTTPVLVAKQDLPTGTTFASALAAGAIGVQKLPAEAVQLDAVSSTAQLGNAVVLQPIFKGEQLTLRRLGAANEQGVRTTLKGAFRAIAVPGDARQLLAGTLRDGDHVDLLVNDHQHAPRTRIALRDLIVLQAPPATSTTSTDLTALIRLTDTQAQVLFWALKNGDWSFVLRPASKASTTATAPTGEAAVLKGQ